MFAQTLVAAFAVIGAVSAQSSICSTATATINAQADVAQYTDCASLKNVLVSTSARDSISLDGIETITGDLTVENAGNLITLGSSSIGQITGMFKLTNLTLLSTLSMTQLTSVGSIAWSALPALSTLTFPATVSSAKDVVITNTFLNTLDGINLKSVNILDINNNNRLTKFSTQISRINQSLTIDANGNRLEVSFPNLVTAANMTFKNASRVSIPSLATVNGSLGFYGNYFTELLAPNLTSVGAALAFVANGNLRNISLPLLKTIGGTNLVANNSAVTEISFPVLTTVTGAIDFSGNFTTVNIPALVDVKGALNVQSTAAIDCTKINSYKGQIVQGTFTCMGLAADAKPNSEGGTGTSSGSSPTTTKSAAIANSANGAVTLLSVVGGLMAMLM